MEGPQDIDTLDQMVTRRGEGAARRKGGGGRGETVNAVASGGPTSARKCWNFGQKGRCTYKKCKFKHVPKCPKGDAYRQGNCKELRPKEMKKTVAVAEEKSEDSDDGL